MTLFCGLLLPFFYLFIFLIILLLLPSSSLLLLLYIIIILLLVLIGVRLCVVVGCIGRSKNRRRKKRIKYNIIVSLVIINDIDNK